MDHSRRHRWLIFALFSALVYFAVGFITSALSGAAASEQMRFLWRLSAFVICAVVFLVHIAYEHFRMHNTAFRTAWHTSFGVGFGAFLLALAANIHDLGSSAGYRPRMLISFVAWPLLTGVPAFLVSFVVAGLAGALEG